MSVSANKQPGSSRPSGRTLDELREVELRTNINAYAEGSCMVSFGNTKVYCTASVDERVPPWMFRQKIPGGWVTAEYGMLPRSTHTRMDREAVKGKQSSRSSEISRLIGRSIRSVVDLKAIGQRTIWLDCDVIQADGGTRTAAITGAFVALQLAVQHLVADGKIKTNPVREYLAAISCGVTEAGVVLDLDYDEDSNAIADSNFVMTESGKLVEVQSTAEARPLDDAEFDGMKKLAKDAIIQLTSLQRQAIQGG